MRRQDARELPVGAEEGFDPLEVLTHARFVCAGSQGEPCPSGRKEQAPRGPGRYLMRKNG